MIRLHTTRFRLIIVTVVFLATAPTLGMIFTMDKSHDAVWFMLLIGALALTLGWFSWGDQFLRQTNALLNTTHRLTAGDFAARTTRLHNKTDELGQLALAIDVMAEALEKHIQERERAERTLLNRTQQQTVIAALGQFAIKSTDFQELLNQAVNLIQETLELEYCGVWEMQPDGKSLLLRAGAGWRGDSVGTATFSLEPGSLAGHVFTNAGGGAVTFTDLPAETRFRAPELLTAHAVVSGVGVEIGAGKQPFGLLGVGTITQRKFSEDEFHFLLAAASVIVMAVNRHHTEAQLEKLASFPQFNPNPVLEFSADGDLTYFNEAAVKMARDLGHGSPQTILPSEVKVIVRKCLATGESRARLETRLGPRTISWSFYPVVSNRIVHCYAGDITDRLNLEAQLRQSQKMESVGQLAAGVAHDFNNMLTIIQGHSGLLMTRPNLPGDLFDSAQAVYFASERAATLTRQLLLFSRKSTMQRKVLDLDEVVANMTKMLKRLLGETVTLDFKTTTKGASVIHADAGMVEQVIVNLSVNARDAMPGGGTLAIRIQPVKITNAELSVHPEARAGDFVCLSVSDNGCGMDAKIVGRIFEPFFTTKDVGKGTGLGLATVYGIVKQHSGWIEVSSKVGEGSTFRVFFPASDQLAQTRVETTDPLASVRGGTETVLVVEDEPVLREMAHLILEECGYRVLGAGNGKEALEVWGKYQGKIDLLLTDMVMPENMSGIELAEELLARQPDLKVVFMSGYTVDEMSEAFLAKNNAQFLQKPYTRTTLAHTVRQAFGDKHEDQVPPVARIEAQPVTAA